MTHEAVLYFLVSVGVFVALLLLTSKERGRGRRLFARGLREKLDVWCERLFARVSDAIAHFLRYIVQLHWYYSIHSVLKGMLRVIVAVYTGVESMFERNRKRTKELRAEKRQQNELSHLKQMSDHKAETALSPAQQRKLRDKQLEGKY